MAAVTGSRRRRAIALAGLATAVAACATAAPLPAVRPDGICFVHRAPGAASVALIASFIGWQPAPMRADGDGRFELTVAVPAGSHRFSFRVVTADGTSRVEPPAAAEAFEDDGFGSKNGVLDVHRTAGKPSNLAGSASSLATGSN